MKSFITQGKVERFGKFRFFVYVAIALPVILFAVYIWHYAANVPFVDDNDLIVTVNVLKDHPTQFLGDLVRQQNDHRILFSRIGALISYVIAGKIDFRVMILLGYFNLVLLCYSFFLIYRSSQKGIWSFVPVVFLLFSPVVYSVHLWAITAFQYTLSVTFSMFSLYYLQPEKRRRWYWSIAFAIMASLTVLDGLSAIPVGFVWLVTQRRWRDSALYLLFSIIYLYLFFLDFQFSTASKFPVMTEMIQVAGLGILAFTGSLSRIFSDSLALKLSLLSGSIILVVFGILQIRKIWIPGQRLSLFKLLNIQFDFTEMAFFRLLACAMMISIGRSSDGPAGVLAIRFSVYSVSIAIIFYFLLLNVLKNKSLYFFKISVLAFSMLLCLFMYIKYDPYVKLMNAELKTDSYNYTHHQRYLHQYWDMVELPPSFYKYYEFPQFFDKNCVEFWTQSIRGQHGKGEYRFHAVNMGNAAPYERYCFPVIEVSLDELPTTVPGSDVYLGILNANQPGDFYLVALKDRNNVWQKRLFKPEAKRRFCVNINDKMQKGVYYAAVCWVENSIPKVLPLVGEIHLGSQLKNEMF